VPGPRLDTSQSPAFKRGIAPVLMASPKVIFDMSELQFVDSTGLGTIVSCLKMLNASGGDLKLCHVVRRQMQQRDPVCGRGNRQISWPHSIDPKVFITPALCPINIVEGRGIDRQARPMILHRGQHLIELGDIDLVVSKRHHVVVF
jgi:hypothetical protein